MQIVGAVYRLVYRTEPQEDWVFRLEVAEIPERPEDISKVKMEILTLPADEKYMQKIAKQLGEKYI